MHEQTNFYVTDTVSDRNRIAYFRHATWLSITATLAVSMKAMVLSAPLTGAAASEAQAASLGCSYIRWLPKEVGARPITNLRRRLPPAGKRGPGGGPGVAAAAAAPRAPAGGSNALPPTFPKTGSNVSINTMLSNAFQVLAYERRRDPTVLGASVMGLGDIYARLKTFQRSLRQGHGGWVLGPMIFRVLLALSTSTHRGPPPPFPSFPWSAACYLPSTFARWTSRAALTPSTRRRWWKCWAAS
jgi:telomerase reverse transcriptase